MTRLTVVLLGSVLLFFASPAHAYVWRCHTPQGNIWTELPNPNGDCEEFDGTYNPSAAPPSAQNYPPQYAPQTAPPTVVQAPPPQYVYAAPYPAPYPPPYPYYYPGYGLYRPGVYIAPPGIVFGFGFGHGHFGHWRSFGHRFR